MHSLLKFKGNIAAAFVAVLLAMGGSAHAALPIGFADTGVTSADVVLVLIASLAIFLAWYSFRTVMKAVRGAKA